MYCFCKNKTCYKSFNKIRSKGIKFQRYYLIRQGCKKGISLLKLSTFHDSKIVKQEIVDINLKKFASKSFLSKTQLKYLKKLRNEKFQTSETKEKTSNNKIKEKTKSDNEDNEEATVVHQEEPIQVKEEPIKIKEEPVDQDSLRIENCYSDLEIKQEKIFDPPPYEEVPATVKEEPMDIDPTQNLMTLWSENELNPQNLLESYSQLTDYQDFLVKNQMNFSAPNFLMEPRPFKGKSSTKSKTYNCGICLKSFEFKADLNFHFQRHHKIKGSKKKSAIPNTYFVNSSQNSKTKSSAVKLKYDCPVAECPLKFKFKSDSMAHVRLFHPEALQEAEKPEKNEFKTAKNDSLVLKFCCGICLKSFKFKSDCMMHINCAHSDANLKKDEIENFVFYKCNECFSIFNHKDLYNQHMLSHRYDSGARTSYKRNIGDEAMKILPDFPTL